jgi:uncharacterized membrane protein
MTEDQIERAVERAIDKLDSRLMGGEITQTVYDRQVDNIEKWAAGQYKAMEH